jgi:transcriptional regulator
MHGYAISERIEQISRDVLRVEEGSLYPALHRMEETGWIKSAWGQSENNRRARYYAITPSGRRHLVDTEESWARLVGAVARVMKLA